MFIIKSAYRPSIKRRTANNKTQKSPIQFQHPSETTIHSDRYTNIEFAVYCSCYETKNFIRLSTIKNFTLCCNLLISNESKLRAILNKIRIYPTQVICLYSDKCCIIVNIHSFIYVLSRISEKRISKLKIIFQLSWKVSRKYIKWVDCCKHVYSCKARSTKSK